MTRVSLRSQGPAQPSATPGAVRIPRPAEPDYRAIAHDADRLAGLPRHTLLRVLHLVAQLPGLTTRDLHGLVYPDRRFEDDPDLVGLLEQRELVRPFFERKRIRDATHAVLTRAGVRVLASGLGVTPETLVARYGLDDASLADRVGRPFETLPRYRMLAALAAGHREYQATPGGGWSQVVPPQLVTWRRHWPPDQPRDPTPEPLRSALPALATLRWGDRTLSFLLLADPTAEDEPLAHNIRPVEFYRPILDALLEEHVHRRESVPRLFVVLSGETPWSHDHGRTARWRALLEDARRRFPHVPFRFELRGHSPSTLDVSRDLRGEPDEDVTP